MSKKLKRGTPLPLKNEALTPGSIDAALAEVSRGFRELYPAPADPSLPYLWIVEIYADYLIVESAELGLGEFYQVTYSRNADDKLVFASRDQWVVVELTYTPERLESKEPDPDGAIVETPAGETPEAKVESVTPPATKPVHKTEVATPVVVTNLAALEGKTPKGKGKKIVEQVNGDGVLVLEAATEGGLRAIRGEKVMTADIVNGNARRYPADVLTVAVAELKTHLHESAGQGRLLQVLGEAEHPSQKGNNAPRLLETVIKWENVNFDGRHVSVQGHILATSQGRDLIAIMEGGVRPGISLRGYGDSVYQQEEGRRIEEVTELHITGFDLVGEPSFVDALAVLENKKNTQQEVAMTLEELKKLIAGNPDLFKGLFEGKIDELGEAQLKKLEEQVRAKLGISADADLGKALTEAVNAQHELAEQKRVAAVNEAITEATKGLAYTKAMNESFVAAVQASNPADANAVKVLVEAKRVEYDAIMAQAKLGAMGWKVTGPVIETELGIPAYAKAARLFTEQLVKRGITKHIDLRQPTNRNELFAAAMLERFDNVYTRTRDGGLIAESRCIEEAEQVSDLSMPYSASRAVLQAAMANLVASGIFDFGVVDTNPTRVLYESYAQDSTVTKTVAMGADSVAPHAKDTWYAFTTGNKRILPGTLTANVHAENAPWVEGTDYVIDYANGLFMALTGGGITADLDTHLGYQYYAIRKGEMGVIERGKGQLGFVLLDCAADRLAQQVSNEAILFSRSQMGWDAVTATMQMIIDQVRRKIDQGIFYLATSAALSVATNTGGTWTAASDPLDDLANYIGLAKVIVDNRYWSPDAVSLSKTNSNALSNWTGFTAAGKFPSADLKENGYVGRIKGLPVFESTEMGSGYILVANRQLVLHRVYQPMSIKGPFPSYDQATAQLVAADQYYAEEYNGDVCPIANKGAYVKVA